MSIHCYHQPVNITLSLPRSPLSNMTEGVLITTYMLLYKKHSELVERFATQPQPARKPTICTIVITNILVYLLMI